MKVLIVDDEMLARDRLQRLVQRVRPYATCAQADSGEAALQKLRDFEAEVVLLDIRMPGMDGLELAGRLAALAEPPAVVFCTAYDEYALEALRQRAAAYLLKPVAEAELAQALDTVARMNRAQVSALRDASAERRVVCSVGLRGMETVPVEEVRCFLAEQKYVTAVAPGREVLLSESLKELEQTWGERFLRVHRNALVAPRYLRRLLRTGSGWQVELDGVEARPFVSRRQLAEVKRYLRGE